MLEIWASHVMRYSRRDQLSVNVAFRQANLQPTAWHVDNLESDLHRWPCSIDRNRRRGSRDPVISLMTVGARVRHLEQKLTESAASTASLRAENERLATENARLAADAARARELDGVRAEFAGYRTMVERRLIKNRLRRLGVKMLRLPLRIAGARKEPAINVELPPPSEVSQVTAPPPEDRVLTKTGSWIYVDPADGRGRKMIETGGNFNPPSLAAWHLILAERAWTHVVDIGANYGEMLVNGGLPAGAEIIGIEPNPAIRDRLERTLHEAGLNAKILDVALSDSEGEAVLRIDERWSGTTRLAEPDEQGTKVRTVTLDTILRQLDADPAMVHAAVKIDIEGHETAVLRGGLSMLSSVGDFAVLVEILHLPPADIAWLCERFDVFLLDLGPGGGLVAAAAQDISDMLGSGRYYRQDAVLRRRIEQ